MRRRQAFRLLSVGHAAEASGGQSLSWQAITTRQATLITIAKEMGTPSMSEVAAVMSQPSGRTSNRLLALERRGFVPALFRMHTTTVSVGSL